MRSRLYECQVVHRRLHPRSHSFRYRIFLFALDLDELPSLHRRLRLFSVARPNLYSFRDTDYFPTTEPLFNQQPIHVCNVLRYNPTPPAPLPDGSPTSVATLPAPPAEAPARSVLPSPAPSSPAASSQPPTSGLKSRLVAHLAAHGIDLTGGRILLVTLPRIAGYLFNPVSFYFCYDHTGTCIAALPEVTNTFREVKPYLLGPDTFARGAFRLRQPKYFYVSPFSNVDVAFDFVLRPPTDQLAIRIDDYDSDRRTLTSRLAGPARPLDDRTLAWFALKYPLLSLRVIALIHWHALRLLLKKIPWFPKAARPADQRDLHRPHASLTRRPAKPASNLVPSTRPPAA